MVKILILLYILLPVYSFANNYDTLLSSNINLTDTLIINTNKNEIDTNTTLNNKDTFLTKLPNNNYNNLEDTFKKIINKTKVYYPKKAALLSAVLPGAGQFYNKKYWKIPIVYGILGFIAYNFFDYYSWYSKTSNALVSFNKAARLDSTDFKKMEPILQRLTLNDVQQYKDNFRRELDNQGLYFLVFWLINIIDAAVDSHFKNYDVSDNLSISIKPKIQSNPFMSNLNGINSNISLTILIKKNKNKNKNLAFLNY